jgi:hypothetical protein
MRPGFSNYKGIKRMLVGAVAIENNDVGRLPTSIKRLSEPHQILRVNANSAPTGAVNVSYCIESDTQNKWKNQQSNDPRAGTVRSIAD